MRNEIISYAINAKVCFSFSFFLGSESSPAYFAFLTSSKEYMISYVGCTLEWLD